MRPSVPGNMNELLQYHRTLPSFSNTPRANANGLPPHLTLYKQHQHNVTGQTTKFRCQSTR